MQTMRSILHISSRGTELTDEYGSTTGIALELMLGTAVQLDFDLRGDAGSENAALSTWPLSSCTANSCYFALDTVTANSAAPKLLRNSGITFAADSGGHTVCSVTLPNTAVTGIVSAIGSQEEMVFRAELGGLDDDGNTIFAWQFDLTIRSRVYLGGGTESVASDPAYYTAAQVEAVLGRALVYEYSIDGETAWHATNNDTDRYYRVRHGANGTPSAGQPILTAPVRKVNGKTGAVVLDADDVGAIPASGFPVAALTGTAVPGAGKLYTYTPAAGDGITFFTPAAGHDNLFELDIQQSSGTAASFTLPSGIVWDSAAPDLTIAGKLYQLKFRYLNGAWHAHDLNAAVPASGVTITDAGSYYTGTSVEAALQEIGAKQSGLLARMEAI